MRLEVLLLPMYHWHECCVNVTYYLGPRVLTEHEYALVCGVYLLVFSFSTAWMSAEVSL